MTAQQLKNSILQMAVQGKLVSQDPTDEPASVLLERIRAEKERLIKEGKIKKEKNPSVIFRGSDNLPYEKIGKEVRCIADEVPFEIPESWEWVRLGNLVDYTMGKTPPRKDSDYWNHSVYPWVSIADMIADGHIKETKEKVNARAAETVFHGKITPPGTLLMSFKLTVGRVSITDIATFHNEAIISIYPIADNEKAITNYLFSVLPLLSTMGNTKSAIKGNTLNSDSLNALLIPLPPLPEQKRIVAKIEELLPHIEDYGKAESKVSKLNAEFPEQLKKSILQWAIQGKLVPQNPDDEPASVLLERIRAEKAKLIKEGKIKKDKNESIIFRRDNSHYTLQGKNEVCIDDEIPFEIPISWVWVRLKTVLEKASTGPFGSMLHKSDYVEQGIPLINPADIDAGRISADKIKMVSVATASRLSSYKLHEGDIIIGRRGEMGRSAVITKETTDWLCGTGCFFVKSHPELLSSEYLVFLLSSPYVKEKLQENSVGTTMANLNHGILGDLLIPLPPLNEQQRILMQFNKIAKRFIA